MTKNKKIELQDTFQSIIFEYLVSHSESAINNEQSDLESKRLANNLVSKIEQTELYYQVQK